MYRAILLLLTALVCSATIPPLVISQVYVVEPSISFRYPVHYVELFNTGIEPVALDGLSLQTAANYSPSPVRPWTPVALSGTLQPGQSYLVELSFGFVYDGASVFDADAFGPSNLTYAGGTVAIIRGSEPVKTVWPAHDRVVDLFGYGRVDGVYLGRPYNGHPGELAFFRKQAGCQNTQDNSVDFYSAAPGWRNTKSPTITCPASTFAPSISDVGIRHAATLRMEPLAPGTLAIVEGKRFIVGRTRVFFDATPAAVYDATDERIVVGVPMSMRRKKSATLTVWADGQGTTGVLVALARASPGVFSQRTAALGATAPLNEDGTPNAPDSPATPGSTVLLSVTGVGEDSSSLRATVGDHAAQLISLTAAPSLAGVYYARVQVPANLAGTQPVRISVDGKLSPALLLHLTPERPVHTDLFTLHAGAFELAYDPFRKLLYAGTASARNYTEFIVNPPPDQPDSVLVIDPASRSIISHIPCGGAPYLLALSANGKHLWATINTGVLKRIDLDRREIEFTLTASDVFADMPDSQKDAMWITAMAPDPNNEDVIVLASTSQYGDANPLVVVEGRRRRTRLGPTAHRVVFSDDGTLWTDENHVAMGADGPIVLGSVPPGAAGTPVMLQIPGHILDVNDVLRRSSDMRREGKLTFPPAFGSPYHAAYVQATGRLYLAGSLSNTWENLYIRTFAPQRMTTLGEFFVYRHELPKEKIPRGSANYRMVSIGSEGFAISFASGSVDSCGGSVLFLPLELIPDYPRFTPPPPQPPSDSVRSFALPTQGATVDRSTATVYFSIPGGIPDLGNSLLPFNSASGTFGEPVWVGSEPTAGVIPSDGRYLYVFLHGARSVKRLRLPSLEADLEFPLVLAKGSTAYATNLLEVPGAPSTTVAVEYTDDSTGAPGGVAIFDNGVARPKAADGYAGSAQFSTSGSQLYAIDNWSSGFAFSRYNVTPDGIDLEARAQELSNGFLARLLCFDSYCVTSSGVMIDPVALKRIKNFDRSVSNAAFAVDPLHDRACFLALNGEIECYETSTGRAVSSARGKFWGTSMLFLESGELLLYGGNQFIAAPASTMR